MADKKISQLLENTTPSSVDLVPHVDDPAGTPVTKRTTLANLSKGLVVANMPDFIDEDNMASDSATKVPSQQSVKAYVDRIRGLPEGFMINGRVVPTVSAGDLTLTLKGMDGNDISASNPVFVRINNVVYTITAPLTVTQSGNDNHFNTVATELADKEVDYFPYLGIRTSNSAIYLIMSRIPYATLGSDFSDTFNNEKYGRVGDGSLAPSAFSQVVNIGRFAASHASGTYDWSVPTFTQTNLVNIPTYETRWLDWLPTYTGSGSLTYTSVTTTFAKYKIVGRTLYLAFSTDGTTGGTTSTALRATVPFTTANNFPVVAQIYDGALLLGVGTLANTYVNIQKYDNSNYGLGSSRALYAAGFYSL